MLNSRKSEVLGYTTGCFDLFHHGHVNFLQKCKSLCDRLIVGVTCDEKIKKEKNRTPLFTIEQRIRIVSSCKFVDAAIIHSDRSKQDAFRKIKFKILFIGDDHYKEAEYEEMKSLCDVVYIPYTHSVSSTLLRSKLVASS